MFNYVAYGFDTSLLHEVIDAECFIDETGGGLKINHVKLLLTFVQT